MCVGGGGVVCLCVCVLVLSPFFASVFVPELGVANIIHQDQEKGTGEDGGRGRLYT